MNFELPNHSTESEKKATYPVIYCDENLYVADISPTAAECGFSHLQGCDLSSHLTEMDEASLLSLLYHKTEGHESRTDFTIFVDLLNIRRAQCAHVKIVSLFGRYFFEMRLFRSRISMFKDFDVSRLLLTDMPYAPEYDLRRNRLSILDSRDKLEKVFSAGRLVNLYHSALDPLRKSTSFDAVETTRRIFADLSFSMDLGGAQFPLYVSDKEAFVHAVIDASNYVNLVALLMSICSKVTSSGKVETEFVCTKDRASLVFRTQAKRGQTHFLGGFAFMFLAEMYPEIAALVWAARYIGELFGLRCYAELSGKNTLAVELLMKAAPPDIEIGVMHPDEKAIESLIEEARSIVYYMENASFPTGSEEAVSDEYDTVN